MLTKEQFSLSVPVTKGPHDRTQPKNGSHKGILTLLMVGEFILTVCYLVR